MFIFLPFEFKILICTIVGVEAFSSLNKHEEYIPNNHNCSFTNSDFRRGKPEWQAKY